MKINRYCHDHGISHETLAKVAAKNYRNGVLNPKAFRRQAICEEEILASPMLNYPLTAKMFCAPDEGAAALVMCRADIAHRYTDTPGVREGDGASAPATTAPTRCPPPGRRSRRTSPPPSTRRGPPTRRPGIGPEDVDVIQLQDTDAGAEVIHMAENGFCADGEQEKLVADGATEISGPDAGQHRRRPHRQRRAHRGLRAAPGARARACSCGAPAGDRQVPGDPRVGYAQVYGAPGTAAVTILTR